MLDAASVAAADPSGQIREALGLGEHLRDALWRVDSAAVAPRDARLGLVVAGMGGSAVGGRLAAGVLGRELRRPLAVADDYVLPGYVGPDTLVLCASYSGGTEETLAAYDEAKARSAPRLVATTGGPLAERARSDGVPVIPLPGGFQPRAAIGYSLAIALEAAALSGAAPSQRSDLEAAADLVHQLAEEWGPAAGDDSAAKRLARRLLGTIPVVIGAEAAAGVAYRWKCQLNENSKVHAFSGRLPEVDHNEIVGWASARDLGPFSLVVLEDGGAHPRNALRAELTARAAQEGADVIERVAARGETPLQRAVSLILLGDLVSLYLAILRGVDPAEIRPLTALKAELAAR